MQRANGQGAASSGRRALDTSIQQSKRDWRIDFWRGAAILMIFVDHIPDNIVSLLTMRSYGISDAAELFVFLSGFSLCQLFMSVYRNRPVISLYYATSRALYLYLYHLAMALILASMAVAYIDIGGSQRLIYELNLYPFIYDTQAVVGRIVGLTYLPTYLDILPLYIVLTVFASVLFIGFGNQWKFYAVTSVALYIVIQMTGLNLPGNPDGTGWFFNPIAWQVIFFAGFVCALVRAEPWVRSALNSRALLVAASVIAVLGVIVAAPWAYQSIIADWRPLAWVFEYVDKQSASPLRILHFFSIIYLGARLITLDLAWDRTRLGAVLCAIGQRSLRMFMAGIFLSVFMRAALYLFGYTQLNQVFASAIGVTVLCVVGVIMKRADSATLAFKKAV